MTIWILVLVGAAFVGTTHFVITAWSPSWK